MFFRFEKVFGGWRCPVSRNRRPEIIVIFIIAIAIVKPHEKWNDMSKYKKIEIYFPQKHTFGTFISLGA